MIVWRVPSHSFIPCRTCSIFILRASWQRTTFSLSQGHRRGREPAGPAQPRRYFFRRRRFWWCLGQNLKAFGLPKGSKGVIVGSIRETPQRGPFLALLMALLKGTLLRGSISPRVPLILTPRLWIEHEDSNPRSEL